KNFFTILMLSTFKKSGLSDKKIIEYGKISFALRTIITSTDNMIDNEEKGVLFLKKPKNSYIKNSLFIILSQNIIDDTLGNLEDKSSDFKFNILNKIYSIAMAEDKRELSDYTEYPKPDFVTNILHSGIGGELLSIAFEAPLLLEQDKTILEKLMRYKKGIYKVGMALQSLDDLCDIIEDYKANKVNLGTSKLIYDFNYSYEEIQKIENFKSLEFEMFYKSYLDKVINEALEGMKELELSKNEKSLKSLLKYLFKLRGLEEVYKIYENTK
ncbi:MAG: hypothetical protein ACRC6A_05190, partial [Fusobacteriaceae bacterium]